MHTDFPSAARNLNDYIYQVSPATPAHLPGILSILRDNWHRIYRGTVAPDKLDDFIETVIAPHYAGIIAGQKDERQINVAQTKSGTLCGFTCYGFNRDAHEIQAIYVAPTHVKKSIGAMMMQSTAEDMIKLDTRHKMVRPIHIRICTDNEGARAFADKLNGQIKNTEVREFLDARITDQIIGWDNATTLNNVLYRKFLSPLHEIPDSIHGGREVFTAPAP